MSAGPHDHEHGHDHPHPTRPDADENLGYYQVMEIALRELLIEKGVVTAAELRQAVEAMDSRSPAQGAKIVARAWTEPDFKRRLMADGTAAVRDFGIDMGTTRLFVVENTPQVHNLVVCTLCSCYPRMVLGLPPDWYKSRNYRSRAVRRAEGIRYRDRRQYRAARPRFDRRHALSRTAAAPPGHGRLERGAAHRSRHARRHDRRGVGERARRPGLTRLIYFRRFRLGPA